MHWVERSVAVLPDSRYPMNVLLSSHFFHPSIGGMEEVSLLLAHEFVAAGHSVRVITGTAEDDGVEFPFAVLRRPTLRQLFGAVVWCDVFFHNNVSLRMAWPLLALRRPWVVAHHTWIARPDGRVAWQDRLKKRLLRRATNIGGGSAMTRVVDVPMVAIDNPYPDKIFRMDVAALRQRELVFAGRLVSDKGADLLLSALGRLQSDGLRPMLSVIGSGPEEQPLRNQCHDLGLADQVIFVGRKSATDMAALLNRHRILVVPSRWSEPFGLVALEGIACGCFVIGSEQGGLKAAIGPCGVTFPNGDVAALTDRLREALQAKDGFEPYLRHAEAHLAKHRPAAVAKRYLAVFEEAIEARKRR